MAVADHVKYGGATSCSVTTHSRVAVSLSSTLMVSGANISVFCSLVILVSPRRVKAGLGLLLS